MAVCSFEKGGIFLLLLLSSLFAASQGTDPLSLIDRQVTQLNRLETLVETLSRTVSRLESSLSGCSRPPSTSDGPEFTALSPPREIESPPSYTAGAAASGIGEEDGGGGGRALRRPGGIAVTKYKPSWSERFQFAAAVRLESEATCAAVLPYEDYDGVSKYFAVGDARGRVFVFSSAGDVLIELPAPPSDSPVTAMLAYMSLRRNESFLFTGHGDGSIMAHRLWESTANSDDWLTLTLSSSRSFVGGGDHNVPPVLGLEVHQIGRIRYVVASDDGGRIRVFTENGTLYGTTIASGRPLAFMKQRLLFLTETHAGVLDLRSMTVRETECEGLDGTHAKSYAFDVSERSKAYGFTSGGDLVQVAILGDAANLKCRVRTMRKSEIEGPISIQTIKGYLLVVNHEKVFVYNVSSQYYSRAGTPRPLFFATLEEIKSLFLNSGVSDNGKVSGNPLIAVDREKLLVLGLGGGYVGVYRSNFPVFKVESNAVLWSSPALLFLLFLIGIWQFYVKKREALGWTPDEAFNASTGGLMGPPAAAGGGDRAFVDSSRPSDHRDIRGGARRRYVSPPSRYPGGPSAPFRPASADPGFRGAADLKYRGQGMEPPGFPKRREPMFTNSQVVGDDQMD